jgi:hypothetical protein
MPTWPIGPTVGQMYTNSCGSSWIWNGYAWIAYSEPSSGSSISVQDNGTTVGSRPNINFIAGAGIAFSIQDSSVNDRVDVLTLGAITYSTYSAIASLVNSSTLQPGTWYSFNFVSTNPITMYFEYILYASTSNKFATRGHRVMRVPKKSIYTSKYFSPGVVYPVGTKVVFGNIVYDCISATASTPLLHKLDPTYWTPVSYTNNAYYETVVYDVDFDFDELKISVQYDDKGNVTRRTESAVPFDETISSIDLHEWNNPFIKNNDTFGIWNNYNPSNTDVTSIPCKVEHNTLKTVFSSVPFLTPESGYITRNSAVEINLNRVSSIDMNEVVVEISRNTGTSISDNNCNTITDNNVRGTFSNVLPGADILDNIAINIGNNTTTGNIQGNHCKGNISLNQANTITYNNVDRIEFNSCYGSISNNDIMEIYSNTTGGISDNSGRANIYNNFTVGVISSNFVVNGSIYNNYCTGDIIFNNVKTGIFSNASTIDGIDNNFADYISNNQ